MENPAETPGFSFDFFEFSDRVNTIFGDFEARAVK
ncbi:hypothetical protein IWQ48_002189 [Labrenzia sp. EL_13]|nr:hypothetical protein [Labrenzia sp. EL_13]